MNLLHMSFQITMLGERLFAHDAFVWSFFHVRSQVVVEFVEVCERLPATHAVLISVLTNNQPVVWSKGFISHQVEEVEILVAAGFIFMAHQARVEVLSVDGDHSLVWAE